MAGPNSPGPTTLKGNARNKLGNVDIYKGSTKDGIPVVMWDAIPPCDEANCNIAEQCPHVKTGKCGVRLRYLNHVYEVLIGQVEANNPLAMFSIGFHLVPLYNQLVQFKMVEMNAPVMMTKDNGTRYVNPIFKEIRDTIRAISIALKDIAPSLAPDTVREKITDGDPGYYEGLFEDGSTFKTKKRNRV